MIAFPLQYRKARNLQFSKDGRTWEQMRHNFWMHVQERLLMLLNDDLSFIENLLIFQIHRYYSYQRPYIF